VDTLFDKPILHFSDNFDVLSIGSWGCNFRCRGCQNAWLSWTVTGEGLGRLDLKPKEIAALTLERGCKGIAYTYNEPAVLLDSLEEIAAEAKTAGLVNILVTNSTFTPESAGRIASLIDVVAADIKSMDDSFYFNYCGAEGIGSPADKILACIRTFRAFGCHVEVRTNVIPGGNDQEDNFRGIAGWIKKNLGAYAPWHITRFFPAHELRHLAPTPATTLFAAQRIGRDSGLSHVHVFLDKGCDCAPNKAMMMIKGCCH
jgi:pyruvate formate lyase activating enzyme